MEQNITYQDFIQNILNTRGRFGIPKGEYKERHHIVPKCIGGTNDKDNLIDLYAHEHYIAHKLLALENPSNNKLILAWHRLHKDSFNNYITEYEYEKLKTLNSEWFSNLMKNIERNPEWCKKIGEANSRRELDENFGLKISNTKKEKYKQKLKIRLNELIKLITREEFDNIYRHNNIDDTINYFRSKLGDFKGSDFKLLFEYWKIEKRTPKETNDIKIKTMYKNYGVINNFQREEVKDICKEVKKEKYGDEYYSNQEKANKTKIEKFGTLNMFSLKK